MKKSERQKTIEKMEKVLGRKKIRKPSRKLLIKKLDLAVKNIVKARDKSTCQYCGKKVEGSNCHASHVIPVSKGHGLRWDPLNIKVLCYHHHINWWHKNIMESSEWFKNKFPDRWEYLQYRKNNNITFTTLELAEMLEELNKGDV